MLFVLYGEEQQRQVSNCCLVLSTRHVFPCAMCVQVGLTLLSLSKARKHACGRTFGGLLTRGKGWAQIGILGLGRFGRCCEGHDVAGFCLVLTRAVVDFAQNAMCPVPFLGDTQRGLSSRYWRWILSCVGCILFGLQCSCHTAPEVRLLVAEIARPPPGVPSFRVVDANSQRCSA